MSAAEENPAEEKVIKWITLEYLGIDENNLPANWSSKTSHELLLDELSKRKGDEFVHLYPDDSINKEYHAIAYAAKRLFFKLLTTDKVIPIILSALLKAAQEDLRNSMPVLYASIEQSIKEDLGLYAEYVALKEEALNRISSLTKPNVLHYEIPPKNEDAERLIGQAMNTPAAKKYQVHLKFANETRKDTSSGEKNFQLARAVLELAKSNEKGALVQRKYDEALEETSQRVVDMDATHFDNYMKYQNSQLINQLLMEKLSEKFEKDPELGSDVEAMKKKVVNFDN